VSTLSHAISPKPAARSTVTRPLSALRRLKSRAVAAAAWILYATGVLHALLYVRLRKRAVVLMYHRVIASEDVDRAFSHPGIVVEARTFDKHLRLLRKHLRVVPLEVFGERMRSGAPFPSRTCLVTFDDGWSDNHARALPLLAKHGLPAVVFLPTAYIDGARCFWQETLTHAAFLALQDPGAESGAAGFLRDLGFAAPFPPADARGREAIHEQVVRLKGVPAHAREALLARAEHIVATRTGPADRLDTFLSWAQVRAMADAGIRFGSHGRSHEPLTGLPRERVLDELRASKRTIETALGTRVVAFSYPNGDYDAGIRDAVAACGFDVAFTTEDGTVSAADDRYRIRRVNVHEGAASTVPLLMARIAGLL
jgi:peptidoglycan/xylan/chitin deacetylase (PgdA/CDA1 family)